MTAIKNIPPNRAVAVLTPLVFAPLAGALSVAAAKYAPGVTIDQGSLEAVFIAGATIALGPAGLWLKGWQAQEQRAAEASAGGLADPIDHDDSAEVDRGPDEHDADIDPDEHDADLDPDLDADLDLDLDEHDADLDPGLDAEPDVDVEDHDADLDPGLDAEPDVDVEDHELMALTGAAQE